MRALATRAKGAVALAKRIARDETGSFDPSVYARAINAAEEVLDPTRTLPKGPHHGKR
jgi:hypothetical protein